MSTTRYTANREGVGALFSKLVLFELRRLTKNPKNLAVLLVFFLALMGYFTYNHFMDLNYTDTKLIEYNQESQFLGSESLYYQSIVRHKEYYTPEEQIINEKLLAFVNEDYKYTSQQVVYANWDNNSGSRWKDVLLATINKEKNVLSEIDSGILPKRYSETYGTASDITKRIEMLEYLYDNDIKPIYSPYNVTGWQFLYKIVTVLFPILIPIILVLLCGDSMAAEADAGSFKFLLLQPVSRGKVFAAKALSSFLVTLFAVVMFVGAAFLVSVSVNGFGDGRYPVEWAENTNVDGSGEEKVLINHIAIESFVMGVLPGMVLYLLFLAVMCTFISTLASTSLMALSACISVVLASFILQPYIPISGLAWYPLAYADINAMMVYNGGQSLWVLAAFAAILFTLGLVIFRKRDILC